MHFRFPRTSLALFLVFLMAPPDQVYSDTPLSHSALFGPDTNFCYFENARETLPEKSEGFSLELASLCSQACLLSYVEQEPFIEAALARIGFTETRFYEVNGTDAFLAINEDSLLLAFRGTESGDNRDLITDSKIVQAKFFDYGRAHRGFIQALENLLEQLDTDLDALFREKQRRLIICGHSLGGALATLYGLHQHDKSPEIYTIGCPRVGGISFAKNAEKRINVYRILNDNDLIPKLPTPPFYKHIGASYFITSSKELEIDPSFSVKWESRRKGHTKVIKQLFQDHWLKGDFNAVPTAYIIDHSPRLYSEALIEIHKKQTQKKPTD